jgi:hypothetical protein
VTSLDKHESITVPGRITSSCRRMVHKHFYRTDHLLDKTVGKLKFLDHNSFNDSVSPSSTLIFNSEWENKENGRGQFYSLVSAMYFITAKTSVKIPGLERGFNSQSSGRISGYRQALLASCVWERQRVYFIRDCFAEMSRWVSRWQISKAEQSLRTVLWAFRYGHPASQPAGLFSRNFNKKPCHWHS